MLPLSIAVVVAAIALVPSTADVLTWVALLLVPPGCALALGWAARGARPSLAVLAAPLLALAWAAPDTRAGQLADDRPDRRLGRHPRAPAGRRRAAAAAQGRASSRWPPSTRASCSPTSSQAPNAVLVAASPGPGLPQLQSASFGGAGLGYGDFFAAAVVGGILAAERGPQLAAAARRWSSSRCAGTSSSSSTTCSRRPSRRRSCSLGGGRVAGADAAGPLAAPAARR